MRRLCPTVSLRVGLVLAIVLASLAALSSPPAARALIYMIPDGDVNGLIQTIVDANNQDGPDVINLFPGGTYVLTAANVAFFGNSGLPLVTSQLTIYGHGATITRSAEDGTPAFRIVTVASGGDLTLDEVTISNGIENQGAGIYVNNATLRLSNSTVTGNQATSQGGGIDNQPGSTMSVINSTISGNTAVQNGGGGIMAYGLVTITNSTISDNTAGFGGGIYQSFGQATLTNTLVAGNTSLSTSVEVRGSISGTNNLIGDGTGMSGLTNGVAGNQVGTADDPIDPLLGPLQDNGGPTPTMALLSGSPAIDAGITTDDTPETDQRETDRPQGTANDIGAYELTDATAPVIIPTVTGTMGNNGWYTSDVNVSWSVTEAESRIVSSNGCTATTITTDTATQTLPCDATSVGGATSAPVTIKRDTGNPTVTYTGNLGTYALTDTIAITCTATDATSGIATDTCADISGDATTFGLGSHTFSATATDNAGNVGTGTTSFVIGVSYAQLCTLTKDVASHPVLANAACASLILAQRADQANNAQVERFAQTLYRFQIRLAMAFRAFSAADGQDLLDWLDAVD